VEDAVYIGLGLLLAASAVTLLGSEIINFVRQLSAGTIGQGIVDLLDRILLILLILELLYSVQVSFRAHALVPEPFLLIGLIAAIRRILVLTAEFPKLLESGAGMFREVIGELGILTVLILVLVVSLVLLRKRPVEGVASR
jgi:hypothetical protein